VDPRAGLVDVEKRQFLILLGLELRPLCRSARSQSLYRLSYHGSWCFQQILINKHSFTYISSEAATNSSDLMSEESEDNQ
jgi:hypothetical protein